MMRLTLRQGTSSAYYWDLDGFTGVDLAGWSARCQVRDGDVQTGELLAELTATVARLDTDRIRVLVSHTDVASRAWAWREGWSDVLLRRPDGEGHQVVWQGRVELDRVVTQR